MKDEIKKACKKFNFVAVEFRANQHTHTIKAYGEIFPSPYAEILNGQLKYIEKKKKKDRTDVCDIRTASTMLEAIENEIIAENGDIY